MTFLFCSLCDCLLAVHEPSQKICIVVYCYKIYIAFFVICRVTQSCSEETMERCRKDDSEKAPGKLVGRAKSSWQRELSVGYTNRESPVWKVVEKCQRLCVQQNCNLKSQICYKKTEVLKTRDAPFQSIEHSILFSNLSVRRFFTLLHYGENGPI